MPHQTRLDAPGTLHHVVARVAAMATQGAWANPLPSLKQQVPSRVPRPPAPAYGA